MTAPRRPLESWPWRIAAIALLTVAYVIAGKLGLRMAIVHHNVTAVWPPTGLALATLLRFGAGLWPGVFLGAFITNLTTAGGPATSFGIAVGNTLEAVVGAALVRRLMPGPHPFTSARSALLFAALGGVSTLISAGIGVASLTLGGFAQRATLPHVWLTWWMGDMVSDLIIAPLLLLWTQPEWPELTPSRAIEAAVLAASTALVGASVFGGWFPAPHRHYPVSYLTLPALVWAALRFRAHGASAIAALLSGIAIMGTVRGVGPFAIAEPNVALLLVQGFMGVSGTTALVLASAVAERSAAQVLSRQSEQRLRVSLREKEVLLQEIHHRVKNNLQVVCSLLSLQADQLGDNRDAARLLADSEHRVRSMALVHEALYGSSTLSEIEMDAYVRKLAEELLQAYSLGGRVQLTVEAEGVRLAIDRAVPIGLILNELVSNACKHAFADGRAGRVGIRLRSAGAEGLDLIVEDSGIGMPATVDVQAASSLGLRLVQALAEQLTARLVVERGAGTRVVVHIPTEADPGTTERSPFTSG